MIESSSPLPEVFVERILDYTDGDAVRHVTVRIYKPVQYGAEEWGCTLELQGLQGGLGQPYRHEFRGGDSVQALFEGLRMAGIELDRHRGKLSWRGKYKPWEPAGFRDTSDMFL